MTLDDRMSATDSRGIPDLRTAVPRLDHAAIGNDHPEHACHAVAHGSRAISRTMLHR